jgi:hypothetical protein
MASKSRRPAPSKVAADFSVSALSKVFTPPKSNSAVYGWTLDAIMSARNAQMLGKFREPARMAVAMRTDSAIFTAYEYRLAPQNALSVVVKPAPKSGRLARDIARDAERLVGIKGRGVSKDTLTSIHSSLVDHGIAFAINVATPDGDGISVNMRLQYWPTEFVEWDELQQLYVALDESGARLPIVHGDGRWTVFRKQEFKPHAAQAVLLPACLIWACHAFSLRDWMRGSKAHGNAKVVGELPIGVELQTSDGQISPAAAAFIELIQGISTGDADAGIRPAGSKTEYLTNNSSAWQVWSELSNNAERMAARVYLGTDGVLGSQGGAPGVDIKALFGVALTKVQGDLEAIERGIYEGFLVPWCAINYGDSSLTPTREYVIPDTDSDAAIESYDKRLVAMLSTLKELKAGGFVVTQTTVDELAEAYGVEAPQLPTDVQIKGPSIQLAPTDIVKFITVNEARSAGGLGPLPGVGGAVNPDGEKIAEDFTADRQAARDAALNRTAPAIPDQQP